MSQEDWKKRLGIVYSTGNNFDYSLDEKEETVSLPKQQQPLRVSMEKNHRGGKTVTLVRGFLGTAQDMKDLGKKLKCQCGVGGSVKEGEILLQGDFCQRVKELLKEWGYTQTK